MQRLKAWAFDDCNPRSQIMRVITGSRPGVFGCRISPVQRRLWKTAPNGARSPIFCATCNNPSGVARLPHASPKPYLEVETGYVATIAPFSISISFWSRTLMITRVERVGAGIVSAGRGKAHKIRATTRAEERNIRPLLLRKPVLSRGNWRGRAGSAEGEFRRPRQERRKGDIEEAALKHEQERYRQELPMSYCEPDEVAKIDREGQFCDRQCRFQRPVFATPPRLRFSLDPVLRCPREIRFVIEDRFQDGACVVERQTDTEREQARKEQHLFHPSARMKL